MPNVAAIRAEIPGLVALAIPLIAGLVGATALGAVDAVMLGPLGALPLAAVSLTTSVLVIFYAALYGFMGPVGLLVGQAHGAGQSEQVASVLRHGLLLGLGGGLTGAAAMAAILLVLPYLGQPPEVLAVLAPYWLAMSALLVPYCLVLALKQMLDAVDRAWTGAALMLVPLVVNVPLNALLIHGGLGVPALGLTGAGIASLVAYLAGLTAMLAYLGLARSMAPYRRAIALGAPGLREQVREGLPMSFQYLLEGGAVAVAGVMIGWIGATALAANQIAFAIGAIIYMAPLGLSGAVGIRISQAVGAHESGRIRTIGLAGLAVVTIWMVVFSVLLVVGGRSLAAAFIDDAAVITVAGSLFLTFGLMQIFDGVQSVSLGALRGMLDNQWPTRVSLIAYWLVALPLAYALGIALELGAAGVWGGFGAGLAVAAGALLWRFLARTADRPIGD